MNFGPDIQWMVSIMIDFVKGAARAVFGHLETGIRRETESLYHWKKEVFGMPEIIQGWHNGYAYQEKQKTRCDCQILKICKLQALRSF